MKHISIQVYGRVQGVYYRASTKEQADLLGVKGFVTNQSDGSVYIEAEGADTVLEMFVTWCRQGPPHAVVERLEIQEGKWHSFTSFEIKRW